MEMMGCRKSVGVFVLVVQILWLGSCQAVQNGQTFDFIIVGGGTAGCAVAGRLAESGKYSVLLIQDGGLPPPGLDIPATIGNYLADPELVKFYPTAPLQNAGHALNGTVTFLAGKSLGGSSTINGMYLNRGNPSDYDNWANLTGVSSWSYANLLPYFRKYENYVGINPTDQRGYGGPISVANPSYSPSLPEWLQAGRELGYHVGDPNGPQTEGFAWLDRTMKFGRRVSSYSGYIKGRSLPTLTILLNTTGNRIMFDGRRAVGIRFTTMSSSGSSTSGFARARLEVIISAGVVDSPAILLRSGIGPREALEEARIPPVKYLPVGVKLQDQVSLINAFIFGNDSTNYVFDPERDLTPEASLLYNQTGEGPFSSYYGAGSQAFLLSSTLPQNERQLRWPDIHLIALHTNAPIFIAAGTPIEDELLPGETTVSWSSLVVRPRSRGTVRLNSTDVDGAPLVDLQLLAHPLDFQTMVEAIKFLIRICEETPSFRKIGCRYPSMPLSRCAHLRFRSDPYWRCYVRQLANTGIHAGGTCRMGRVEGDPDAVVDSELKVIGIERLRVVDASVMPAVTNVNTMGAVYVIAEKAADMILKEWDAAREATKVGPRIQVFWKGGQRSDIGNSRSSRGWLKS